MGNNMDDIAQAAPLAAIILAITFALALFERAVKRLLVGDARRSWLQCGGGAITCRLLQAAKPTSRASPCHAGSRHATAPA